MSALKTGVAALALLTAFPAAAYEDRGPAPAPASSQPAPDADTTQIWGDATPDVQCPNGPADSAAWQTVPDEVRKVAKPGQCFSRLLVSPQFETYMDHVLVTPAHTETRVIPAVTRVVERDVMVAPERRVRRIVPAVTHMETVTEVVRPASVREEHVEAQYETRTTHVMTEAPQQVWTRSRGIAGDAALVTPDDHQAVPYRADGKLQWPGKYDDESDGQTDPDTADYVAQGPSQDVWCLDQKPGKYAKRTERVMTRQDSVRSVEVPAVTRQVERRVVDQPESEVEEVIPAVTERRQFTEVVTPEHTETYQVPAVYQDVKRQRVVGQPKVVWREVLCSKNATPKVIMLIQRALAARGYQPGAIDGHLGRQTATAMQKFQADQGLPQGQVSVEAVQALGIDLQHR